DRRRKQRGPLIRCVQPRRADRLAGAHLPDPLRRRRRESDEAGRRPHGRPRVRRPQNGARRGVQGNPGLPVSERPLKLRLLLFLYSTANMVGCAFALVGPMLLFAGFIDRGWWLITLGLYGAGYLIGRRPPEIERHIETTLSVEQTLERLD